jgi:hypothetical protein
MNLSCLQTLIFYGQLDSVFLQSFCFSLTYWDFHFQNFHLIFSQNFHIFIEILFALHCLPYLIQLFICIPLEFTLICVLFNFVDHSYNHSFQFIIWGFIYFTVTNVSNCVVLTFRGVILPFSYFLCFCIGICTSCRSFNHPWSFYWHILNVQAGLYCGRVVLQFLTTSQGTGPQQFSEKGIFTVVFYSL